MLAILPICFQSEESNCQYRSPSDHSSNRLGSVLRYLNHPQTGYKVPIENIGNPRTGAITVFNRLEITNPPTHRGHKQT